MVRLSFKNLALVAQFGQSELQIANGCFCVGTLPKSFLFSLLVVSSSPVVSSQHRSHHYGQHQKRSSGNHHSSQNSFLLVHGSQGENTGESHAQQQQQCLSQSLFDNSMFLLPASSDDPMSGCNPNSSGSNFLQPAMSIYSQQQQPQQQPSNKQYNVHQSYISMSGSPSSSKNSNSQMLQRQQQSQQHPEHLILPPISSNNPGSSYVNFNLSTIFPEINFVSEKLAVHGLLPTQPAPISVANPNSKNSVSTSSSVDMRQLATPDLLPHSIAMLGHSTHQVESQLL